MLQATQAEAFAKDWIQAWNSHDLEAILAHYAEGVRFHSPFLVKLGIAESGAIEGKAALRNYFARGLEAYPQLRFVLKSVLLGTDSVVLAYASVENKSAAELMVLDERGKVVEVRAHYAD